MASYWIYRTSLVGLFLALALFLKLPLEQQIRHSLLENNLQLPSLQILQNQSIRQSSTQIMLGELRPLAAALLHFEAIDAFEEQDWDLLVKQFDWITRLHPFSKFYWDTAGWHAAYNAYAFSKESSQLSASQRYLESTYFLEQGRHFWKQGSRWFPKDYYFYYKQALLWSQIDKRPEMNKAISFMQQSLLCTNAPSKLNRQLIYLQARRPKTQEQAYWKALASLETGKSHAPILKCLVWVLQTRYQENPQRTFSLKQLFGNHTLAKQTLEIYSRRSQLGFPMDGIQKTIDKIK